MNRDGIEVHKLANKEQGQYQAILTEQAWSLKELLYGKRVAFSCWTQQVIQSEQELLRHLARLGGQSQRRIQTDRFRKQPTK